MFDLFNAITSLLLSVLLGWALMTPRIKDGIIIKLGLGCLSLGFFLVFAMSWERPQEWPLTRVYALINLGMLICLVGYLLRRTCGDHFADFFERNRKLGHHRRHSDHHTTWI